MQKKDWKSAKKKLVNKPSEKKLFRFFMKTENVLKSKNEFKSDK